MKLFPTPSSPGRLTLSSRLMLMKKDYQINCPRLDMKHRSIDVSTFLRDRRFNFQSDTKSNVFFHHFIPKSLFMI